MKVLYRFIASASNSIKSFKDIGKSYKILLLSLIPVTGFLIILELFISKDYLISDIYSISLFNDSYNIDTYLIYLISSLTHIIVSVVVIFLFTSKLKRNISPDKHKILMRNVIFACLSFIIAFTLIDASNINLKILSHDRVFHVLGNSSYFSIYFQKFPQLLIGIETKIWCYLFSIIPFTLIALGLIIIVLACFNMGLNLNQVLSELIKNPDDFDEQSYQKGLMDLQSYLSYLSAVLVTSIIATILFFQISVPIISDPGIANSYKSISFSMGICWGVVFSMTMLTMCLCPFYILQKNINKIKDQHVNSNNPHVEWIKKISSGMLVFANLRSIISIISPAIISLLANFI